MSIRNRIVLPYFANRSLRGADAVITTTLATAKATESELGVDAARMVVLPHAAAARFRPLAATEARERLQRIGLEVGEYLLFVGTLEPRKNLDGLLRALDWLIAAERFDGEVVLVGTPGWRTSGLLERHRTSQAGRRVRALGYVADDDLPALYSAARLLVMPSHYEGFGLPVLEAMACGTAVVASDRPPLPEISAGAALHFRASDDAALASAISSVWSDERLRARLEKAGLARAADFSWRRSAEGHLALFERLLRGESPASS
jgi:alpha-1,3-rhamnosyl/mannosyltransferase